MTLTSYLMMKMTSMKYKTIKMNKKKNKKVHRKNKEQMTMKKMSISTITKVSTQTMTPDKSTNVQKLVHISNLRISAGEFTPSSTRENPSKSSSTVKQC